MNNKHILQVSCMLLMLIHFSFAWGINSSEFKPKGIENPTLMATVQAIHIDGVTMYSGASYTNAEIYVGDVFSIRIDFHNAHTASNQLFIVKTNVQILHVGMITSSIHTIEIRVEDLPKDENPIYIISNGQTYDPTTVIKMADPYESPIDPDLPELLAEGKRKARTARASRDHHRRVYGMEMDDNGLTEKNIFIYPNPADERVKIDIPETSLQNLLVFNAMGQVIELPFKSKVFESHMTLFVETKNLPKGNYYVKINGIISSYNSSFLKR